MMMTIADYLASLTERLRRASGDGGELSAILAMEAELAPMAPEARSKRNRFHGCQSQIWLELTHDTAGNRVCISADSDARIVRGLLAIATGLYDGRSPAEIAATPPSLLRDAGLLEALAPSRANGFHRLLVHIHSFAAELAPTGKGRVA